MNLLPPQTVARTGEHVDAMLGVKDYATTNGFGERTVRTWLADGRLHGARKLNGVWMIPADDRPAEPQSHGELSVADAIDRTLARGELFPVPHMPQGASLAGELDASTAFLPLETAARLLGVSEHVLRTHRDYFEVVPFGPHGSLVVPAGRVRVIAGL